MRASVAAAFLCALAALLLTTAAARALPGDAAIELLSPADGATVAPSASGSRFVFTCPDYRTVDFGDGFALHGGVTDYTAALATSAELGGDGRLRDDRRVDLAGPQSDNTLPAGQCATTLGDENRSGLSPGVYWWQVSRICTGCAGSYESSAPRRLVVRADVRPRLSPPRALYGGYPAAFGVVAPGAPEGAAVTLERQVGGGWKRVAGGVVGSRAGGDAAGGGSGAMVIATLPVGRQRVRAVVTVGERFVSPAVGVRARPDSGRRATSAASDGTWAGTRRAPVSFRVADGGRTLRGFRADVTMVCPTVPAPGSVGGQITTQAGVAAFARARVAPDGRFYGVAVRGGSSVLVSGRLRGRALTDGIASLSVGACSGQRSFRAARR
ncbi:hypothetical protein Q5424_06910 [Conexibacter sp. JD483]|uniref:hypothetical protein n=1 Tax=unclassified Conexibacter TaxID=2627773 RepID=UPI002723FB7D|nr:MULTISPECIES: hypothetical protein [unclassified Conexibacter]MDO8186925.1 hypothetical protein [Conexibacter sp. CPCC 205706]MDO8200620.1 hypothetical protein [Conexibacter sp. CPCC 205762]MDR9368802.1 hypothetical protein [Conexibacter sp. JD483]